MTVIRSEELTPAALDTLSEGDAHQIYCGLDTLVTFEVFEELATLLTPHSANAPVWPSTYNFERGLQAPAIDMMLRGFLIDDFERARGIAHTRSEYAVLRAQLDELANAVWSAGLNPQSPKQLKSFFYERMRLPEIWISQKGERKLSLNREVLEKLEIYLHARPIIALILEARNLRKRLSVLETEVSHDGRMRTSYNIAGTNTGRWSSSSDVTGVGTNLQNITPGLRRMFIADPGWKICGIDLEQAESREVGWLCGTLFDDWSYLTACEGGDLHTTTARLIWDKLAWTGDMRKDRKIADQTFYRDFSYRDMAKRGAHGSNYMGTAWTMSRHLKVPVRVMETFQSAYFAAYPCIPRWHQWVAQQVQRNGALVTPFGRERRFFGRPDDDVTLRKAIAFSPQSSTGDRLNLGLWRIWKNMPGVQLLAQVHDAVYFQYHECDVAEALIIEYALDLVRVTLHAGGREFVIPGEAKIGWNWAAHSADNPDGLMKWSAQRIDTRVRGPQGRERKLG
jgi:DNA polymerase-1